MSSGVDRARQLHRLCSRSAWARLTLLPQGFAVASTRSLSRVPSRCARHSRAPLSNEPSYAPGGAETSEMAMTSSSCGAAFGVTLASPVASAPPRSSSVSLRSAFSGLRLQSVGCSTSVMGAVARRSVVVRAAAAPAKKADQAEKRARQNEKKRIYHKSKKSEISTRMKKVFVALDGLKKRTDLSEEDLKPIEVLIAEAFSIIDKAAKVGSLHANKAGHQKSRLSRAKRTLMINQGLYTPSA